jgi:uncharacterized membrane protein
MIKGPNRISVLPALIFASIASTAMVLARAIYSGQLLYQFLIWNLFLAWLPLLFSWLGYMLMGKRRYLLLFGMLWLLFFPNAFYLVTDLIHLGRGGPVPVWFDAIMLFSFALTGLLLGLLSLYLMQSIVAQRCGRAISWIFAALALSLSGYGVYVGRFLRWNSWDIFAHPHTLMLDILNSLLHPQMVVKTYTVSFFLSAVFLFAYVTLLSLPRIALEPQRE